MFSPQTVFVVGAGASCDFGFPTGDNLRTEIAEALKPVRGHARFSDERLSAAVMSLSKKDSAAPDWTTRFYRYVDAAERIRSALPVVLSIDNLLHAHRADKDMLHIGKLAIASVILQKEQKSALFARMDPQRAQRDYVDFWHPSIIKSWHLALMRYLATGTRLDQIDDLFDNVAFIVFNYDRCLEQFLVRAVSAYFHVNLDRAAAAVSKLTIVHPYGQVGRLPWQEGTGVENEFGGETADLNLIARDLLTFTESAEDGTIRQVKELVAGAESMVFLGFGYLPQNMNMLSVEQSDVRRIFATMLGIGEHDVRIAEAEIGEALQRQIRRTGMMVDGLAAHGMADCFSEDGTCRDLMDHHWLRLTRHQG